MAAVASSSATVTAIMVMMCGIKWCCVFQADTEQQRIMLSSGIMMSGPSVPVTCDMSALHAGALLILRVRVDGCSHTLHVYWRFIALSWLAFSSVICALLFQFSKPWRRQKRSSLIIKMCVCVCVFL